MKAIILITLLVAAVVVASAKKQNSKSIEHAEKDYKELDREEINKRREQNNNKPAQKKSDKRSKNSLKDSQFDDNDEDKYTQCRKSSSYKDNQNFEQQLKSQYSRRQNKQSRLDLEQDNRQTRKSCRSDDSRPKSKSNQKQYTDRDNLQDNLLQSFKVFVKSQFNGFVENQLDFLEEFQRAYSNEDLDELRLAIRKAGASFLFDSSNDYETKEQSRYQDDDINSGKSDNSDDINDQLRLHLKQQLNLDDDILRLILGKIENLKLSSQKDRILNRNEDSERQQCNLRSAKSRFDKRR